MPYDDRGNFIYPTTRRSKHRRSKQIKNTPAPSLTSQEIDFCCNCAQPSRVVSIQVTPGTILIVNDQRIII